MNLDQLNIFKASLEQLKKCVTDKAHNLSIPDVVNNYNNYSNSLGFLARGFSSNFVVGSSSSNVNNTFAMPQQPMMGNGVFDGSMIRHPLYDNIGRSSHAPMVLADSTESM
ncbi:hypothetical protein RJT34_23787 [Clitoria ternatea]|uniref:Uncharacterized protein n=1 Tax=Clitoria ternatea TaxID=43366 RepID=A0AAN9FPH9_CLITE